MFYLAAPGEHKTRPTGYTTDAITGQSPNIGVDGSFNCYAMAGRRLAEFSGSALGVGRVIDDQQEAAAPSRYGQQTGLPPVTRHDGTMVFGRGRHPQRRTVHLLGVAVVAPVVGS
jgi:hypothetical protein